MSRASHDPANHATPVFPPPPSGPFGHGPQRLRGLGVASTGQGGQARRGQRRLLDCQRWVLLQEVPRQRSGPHHPRRGANWALTSAYTDVIDDGDELLAYARTQVRKEVNIDPEHASRLQGRTISELRTDDVMRMSQTDFVQFVLGESESAARIIEATRSRSKHLG